MKAAYGRQLRRYLLTQNPQKIILLGPGVFETATVDTNILMGEKNSYLDELKGVLIKEIKEINSNIEGWLSLNCVSDDKWILLDPLKQKIRQKIGEKSKPLQKWNIRIYRGILTGLNKAVILSPHFQYCILKLPNSKLLKNTLKAFFPNLTKQVKLLLMQKKKRKKQERRLEINGLKHRTK